MFRSWLDFSILNNADEIYITVFEYRETDRLADHREAVLLKSLVSCRKDSHFIDYK